MEGVNAMTNRNRYTSVDSVDNIYIRNSSEVPIDEQVWELKLGRYKVVGMNDNIIAQSNKMK